MFLKPHLKVFRASDASVLMFSPARTRGHKASNPQSQHAASETLGMNLQN